MIFLLTVDFKPLGDDLSLSVSEQDLVYEELVLVGNQEHLNQKIIRKQVMWETLIFMK